MRGSAVLFILVLCCTTLAAELESRVLTHYVPQDLLEKAVRTEGWTEIPLQVAGGVRKGDTVRVWAGGVIDRGNGDQPGENAAGPEGAGTADDPKRLALSPRTDHAFAVLWKTEGPDLHRCLPQGKPLEIKVAKDNERIWLGFNDERGRYADNHLGKGRRHERDPIWVRVEVVRIVVD